MHLSKLITIASWSAISVFLTITTPTALAGEIEVQQEIVNESTTDSLTDNVTSAENINSNTREAQETELVTQNTDSIPGTSIGSFKLTGYCPCSSCSGSYGKQTAIGRTATEGRTIAVDKRVIPLGSHVWINLPGSGWHEFIAEDVGGGIKGKRIDIFKNNHKECFANDCNGYAEVRIVR